MNQTPTTTDAEQFNKKCVSLSSSLSLSTVTSSASTSATSTPLSSPTENVKRVAKRASMLNNGDSPAPKIFKCYDPIGAEIRKLENN